MIKQMLTIFWFVLLITTVAPAQDITVNKFDFATSIEDRAPSGVDTSFTADVGSIFCFTHVKNVPDTAQITHVWYYKDEEKARINLDVKSNDWRTWSSKSILESWTGPWRVIVEDAKGNVLASKTFIIKE